MVHMSYLTRSLLVLVLFLGTFSPAYSEISVFRGPFSFFLGPEVYYMKRKKDTGSKQTGWMYGGHLRIERRRHCALYWAFDGLYTNGRLNGETASGKEIKSNKIDRQVEGRIGYTIYARNCKKLTLVPYLGYGKFLGSNDYQHPSPLHCEFNNRFHYGAVGGYLTFYPYSCLETGVHFKAKCMYDGKTKVKNDPDYKDFTLTIGNEWHYELELPIRYTKSYPGYCLRWELSPFFRYRHYGSMLNFPHDFVVEFNDTKFYMYGLKLMASMHF